jgi:uncharacterized protein (DUF1800 family)
MRPRDEAVILSRLAYGHTQGELEALTRGGVGPWLADQLTPPEGDDPQVAEKLKAATLPMEYGAGEERGKKWEAVLEDRPLRSVSQTVEELWPLRNWEVPMPYQERVRPRDEVAAATWIRGVYSRYQVREVMASFWHDHFNVNSYHDDTTVAATWPHYDGLMRRHALGNFRQLLEEVAKSPAMLVYLNNRTSRSSPANENFARELFELHTLGAENYLNHLYKRWREVPGALKGQPAGYIDQDVYEAARAFTGWTLADGSWGPDGTAPNTGGFLYRRSFHDPYQKRILGVEFEPNGAPMSDGLRTLDLVAFHPATSRSICAKLVRRLVSDNPPKALIERAAKVWRDNEKAPDQIAKVVKVIAESKEMTESWGSKVKRPFEWGVSFIRATGAEIKNPAALTWWPQTMGQLMFGWPTPDGPPDEADPWLGSNSMMGRWNGPFWLCSKDNPTLAMDLSAQTPDSVKTLGEAAEYWTGRILPGYAVSSVSESVKEALKFWAPLETPITKPASEEVIRGIASLAALAPHFQHK